MKLSTLATIVALTTGFANAIPVDETATKALEPRRRCHKDPSWCGAPFCPCLDKRDDAPVEDAIAEPALVPREEPFGLPIHDPNNPWWCGAPICPKSIDGSTVSDVEERDFESTVEEPVADEALVARMDNPWQCGAPLCWSIDRTPRERRDISEKLDLMIRDADAEPNQCWEAPDGQIHCNPQERDADAEPNRCWEVPDDQIHCVPQKRDAEAVANRCWEASDGQIHCVPQRRNAEAEPNQCWEAPDGQIHCAFKRDAAPGANQCWEAPNGQVHCAMVGKREAEPQKGNPWSCGAPICRRDLATGLLAPYIIERDANPQEDNPWSCGAPICRRDPASGALTEREAKPQKKNPWDCGAPICFQWPPRKRDTVSEVIEREAEPQEGNPWSCGAPICRRDPATGALIPDLAELEATIIEERAPADEMQEHHVHHPNYYEPTATATKRPYYNPEASATDRPSHRFPPREADAKNDFVTHTLLTDTDVVLVPPTPAP